MEIAQKLSEVTRKQVFGNMHNELKNETNVHNSTQPTERILALLKDAVYYFRRDLICPKTKLPIRIDKMGITKRNANKIKFIEFYEGSDEYGFCAEEFQTYISKAYLEDPTAYLLERYTLHLNMLNNQRGSILFSIGWLRTSLHNLKIQMKPMGVVEKQLQRQMKKLEVVNADIAKIQNQLREISY